MIMGLQPATLTYIPRDGEYDVICHNCTPGVNLNHTSRSERDDDSPKSIAAQSKPCTGGFIPPIADALLPGVGIKVPLADPFPLMRQPLRDPSMQSPFGGFYTYNLATLNANILGASAAFTKSLVLPTQSSSASEPLPGISPDSSKSSQPDVKASVTASLANIARRASIGKLEKEHHNGPPAPIDPFVKSPAELEAIADAIAASICGQSPAESLASEVSLTAAVEFLKKRKGITSPFRGTSLHRKKSLKTEKDFKTHLSIGKVHKAQIAAGKRRVKGRRRRTARAKRRKPKSSGNITPARGKQEQVNSDTKRRDRREKLQRRQCESNSHGHYHNMTWIPHGRSGVAHR
ncbi:hypothetical protein N7448_010433 [Penicillium atrosanguineum]|nr:hypothetical protein N7526_010362 [Penicillium atrosanguineum]KAJ5119764.1 hypothetical protein N7448_010433 [Penicillium atrosanguineum]